MRVDHGCLDIFVAKEFLDLSDVDAGVKQMRCEAMPKGMDGCMFHNARFFQRILNGKLRVSLLVSGDFAIFYDRSLFVHSTIKYEIVEMPYQLIFKRFCTIFLLEKSFGYAIV
jgi:hypothetical protein